MRNIIETVLLEKERTEIFNEELKEAWQATVYPKPVFCYIKVGRSFKLGKKIWNNLTCK